MEDIRAIYRIFNNLKYEISCLIQSFFILLKWHETTIQLQILIVLISLLMNGWKDISYARGMNSGIS